MFNNDTGPLRYSFHIATAHVCEHIQQKKLDVNKAPPAKLKEAAEDILKFVQKKVQYWPKMSFIQSGSETRIYRIPSDIKLNGMYGGQLFQYNS